MSHQETYRHNEAYAEFLATGWDASLFAKYADTLRPARAGAPRQRWMSAAASSPGGRAP